MSKLLSLPLVVDNLREGQPMFSEELLTFMAAQLITAREWEAAGKVWDPVDGAVDIALLLAAYGYRIAIERIV